MHHLVDTPLRPSNDAPTTHEVNRVEANAETTLPLLKPAPVVAEINARLSNETHPETEVIDSHESTHLVKHVDHDVVTQPIREVELSIKNSGQKIYSRTNTLISVVETPPNTEHADHTVGDRYRAPFTDALETHNVYDDTTIHGEPDEESTYTYSTPDEILIRPTTVQSVDTATFTPRYEPTVYEVFEHSDHNGKPSNIHVPTMSDTPAAKIAVLPDFSDASDGQTDNFYDSSEIMLSQKFGVESSLILPRDVEIVETFYELFSEPLLHNKNEDDECIPLLNEIISRLGYLQEVEKVSAAPDLQQDIVCAQIIQLFHEKEIDRFSKNEVRHFVQLLASDRSIAYIIKQHKAIVDETRERKPIYVQFVGVVLATLQSLSRLRIVLGRLSISSLASQPNLRLAT